MSTKTSISELDQICEKAQAAKVELRSITKSKKNDALKFSADFLHKNKRKLMEANSLDMDLANKKDLQ